MLDFVSAAVLDDVESVAGRIARLDKYPVDPDAVGLRALPLLARCGCEPCVRSVPAGLERHILVVDDELREAGARPEPFDDELEDVGLQRSRLVEERHRLCGVGVAVVVPFRSLPVPALDDGLGACVALGDLLLG